MFQSKLVAAASLVLCLASIGSANTIIPVNAGFTSPSLGAGGYGYQTTPIYSLNLPTLPSAPTGWTFSGLTGVSANGSPFITGSPSGQAAYLQEGYGDPNTITQVVSGFVGHDYIDSVTFSLENRGGNTAGVDVKLDGHDLGTYQPLSSSSFNTVTTPTVVLPLGSHTLTFTGVQESPGGDNTVSITGVSITTTPEPASLVLFGLGTLSLFVAARRRRKA